VLELPHRGLIADTLEDVTPVVDSVAIDRLQRELASTVVPEAVARGLVTLVRATRRQPGVVLGGSPRAAIHLSSAAKAHALLDGRREVNFHDVVALAPSVLTHRMIVEHGRPEDVVEAAVAEAVEGDVAPVR
jgi:MoxR-like ATPase